MPDFFSSVKHSSLKSAPALHSSFSSDFIEMPVLSPCGQRSSHVASNVVAYTTNMIKRRKQAVPSKQFISACELSMKKPRYVLGQDYLALHVTVFCPAAGCPARQPPSTCVRSPSATAPARTFLLPIAFAQGDGGLHGFCPNTFPWFWDSVLLRRGPCAGIKPPLCWSSAGSY